MTTSPTVDFSNDRPLTDSQNDHLNRAAFAERIAGVLLGLPKGSGLVVGIHGPWGDGKTTVLNILRASLDASTDTVAVDFNPWRFTDEPAMLAGFFRVLAGTIRAKLTTKGEDIAGWIEKIGRYASVVDDRFGSAADLAAAKAEAGLEELRSRLFDELARADKRIVVLVDDSGVFGHSNYGSDWLSRWSRERRISAPEYCPRYFTYAVPRNDVPDAEITALLDAAMKQEEGSVETLLTTHLTGLKARRVIEKLRAIETTVDPNAAEMLAIVMAKLGKNIPNPPALFSFAEPPSQAAILISQLRRIPDRARRTAAATRVIEAADPLWFGVECVRWLYLTDKPEKQESNTLTDKEASEICRVLVDRIKSYAAAGALLFDPDLPQEDSLLFEWWRTEGRDPVQAHLVSVFTKDPKQVARFLQSQAPLRWSEGAALPRVSELDANQLKNMKLVIDLDTMAEWIRKHCPGDFDNPEWFPDYTKPLEQRLAEQFMFVYNKWRKDGEPPDFQSKMTTNSGAWGLMEVPGIGEQLEPPNNSMQLTALRAAADPERWAFCGSKRSWSRWSGQSAGSQVQAQGFGFFEARSKVGIQVLED